MLTEIQRHWDNKTANYDIEKYNWPAWALSVIQEVAPEVTELETMHLVLEPTRLVRVQQHVQNASRAQRAPSSYVQICCI